MKQFLKRLFEWWQEVVSWIIAAVILLAEIALKVLIVIVQVLAKLCKTV